MADATAVSQVTPGPSAPSSPPAEASNENPDASLAPQEETRDWMELPMLDKLDSLHLLTEWQFQNVARFRQTMKSDDENASWVCTRLRPTSRRRSSDIVAHRAHWL
jgi:hypothetical protein